MSKNVYIASPEGETGKSTIALGLIQSLAQDLGDASKVGVFRPLIASAKEPDRVLELLISLDGMTQTYPEALGVTYEEMRAAPDQAHAKILARYTELAAKYDAIVVLGSDYTDVATPLELSFNAQVAANLGTPVILVVHGHWRTPSQLVTAVEVSRQVLRDHHAPTAAVIANRVEPEDVAEVTARLRTAIPANEPVFAIPEEPLLQAPSVELLQQSCQAELILGDAQQLQNVAFSVIVAAMTLPNILQRLTENCVAIAPGDRYDLLPGLILAHHSGNFPKLSGIVLTGGYDLPTPVFELLKGLDVQLPILRTDADTYLTAQHLSTTHGRVTKDAEVKIRVAKALYAAHVDGQAVIEAIHRHNSAVVTPLMFEFKLIHQAQAIRKRIVLPEGDDDRILRAADILLRRSVADLTILGNPADVKDRGQELGLNLELAQILDPNTSEYLDEFAEEYTRLRAHKGMTVEKAREVVRDVSYFGTLMVHLGYADGMVSGAAHTTAHTIKPSFEIIKTQPGVGVVSSVFLMCLEDKVLVYGDCAVNPDPNAQQLAEIAISSAGTAAAFGVEPRIAMLSYSTGSSGSGADVEKVREATALAKERRPDLLLEGPIQYDAAVDAHVAREKLPDSDVAGKATVLIFPDLNTGNNTYKAVQRSAGAMAIGPVLQGLNKPVNDLSRGALVEDIVNTVAITVIQAQNMASAN